MSDDIAVTPSSLLMRATENVTMSTYQAPPRTPPPEQQRMRDTCHHPSGTFVPFAQADLEQSIPALFEQRLAENADRVAVKTPQQTLSYGQLNRVANRLAHAILACTGSESAPVALLFDHDAVEPLAFMGTLKAGRGFVSLDPGLPPERLTASLEALGTPLLVTQTQYLALARSLVAKSWQVLNVEDLASTLSEENPGLPITPEDLAVIKLTSGSTGQPKGVIRTHRIALHTMSIFINHFRICQDDRLFIPHAFTFETLAALVQGATVYPYDIRRNGLATAGAWVATQHITYFRTFPTVYRRFMASLDATTRLPHLRLMILGGESVTPDDVRRYHTHCVEPCSFVNVFGSNETGIVASYFLDQHAPIPTEPLPAGYAIAGAATFWLEAHGQRVGFNTVGEVVLQSPYLTLGYWKESALTQAVLHEAPDGNGRVYRSRDLALMQPDGCLIFMGRADAQVKIRGYRVDTAEIEARLITLDTIQEGVVVARTTPQGEQRLVAYIVTSVEPPPTVSDLRHHLAETLPDYMMPSAFVVLDHLPLLEDRKVNRRALPEPDWRRPMLNIPLASPRTSLEASLAEIWTEVLSLAQVGIHDPFLELGGHSLLAMQILARIIERFQIAPPLRTLLEASTVAEMALVITQYQAAQADPDTLARLLAEVDAGADHEAKQHLPTGPG